MPLISVGGSTPPKIGRSGSASAELEPSAMTPAIRTAWTFTRLPGYFEILGCFLAAIHHNIERDILTFGQCRQSGAFDGGNMDEHILAAVGALNEAVSFRGIEPFDNALVHRCFLSLRLKRSGPPRGELPAHPHAPRPRCDPRCGFLALYWVPAGASCVSGLGAGFATGGGATGVAVVDLRAAVRLGAARLALLVLALPRAGLAIADLPRRAVLVLLAARLRSVGDLRVTAFLVLVVFPLDFRADLAITSPRPC